MIDHWDAIRQRRQLVQLVALDQGGEGVDLRHQRLRPRSDGAEGRRSGVSAFGSISAPPSSADSPGAEP